MVKLHQLVKLIRSKNAKPFLLTLDIVFDDAETYFKVKRTGVLNRELFAEMYNTPLKNVLYVEYDEGLAIKVTVPRPVVQGDIEDGDIYGCQQIGNLPDLDITI